MERGYGLPPAELVERLAAAGVAGCNLEDSDPATSSLVDISRQSDFLSGVRAAAAGYGLVVNARVDSPSLEDAVRRGRRYLEAGADCVYPIQCSDPEMIRVLVRELGTVNILASPSAPTVSTLASLGVARISWGPYLHRSTMAYVASLIDDYKIQ
jgi:2-methylisocitrate lyase-like PEP mutase family enzyme